MIVFLNTLFSGFFLINGVLLWAKGGFRLTRFEFGAFALATMSLIALFLTLSLKDNEWKYEFLYLGIPSVGVLVVCLSGWRLAGNKYRDFILNRDAEKTRLLTSPMDPSTESSEL